jgi:hypothetical protein
MGYALRPGVRRSRPWLILLTTTRDPLKMTEVLRAQFTLQEHGRLSIHLAPCCFPKIVRRQNKVKDEKCLRCKDTIWLNYF